MCYMSGDNFHLTQLKVGGVLPVRRKNMYSGIGTGAKDLVYGLLCLLKSVDFEK